MNWGTKITIVYIGFVALILSMVTVSSRNKSELVAKDYYAQELNYQERIDATENEKQLTESLSYVLSDSAVIIHCPSGEMARDLKGEVIFFRPSDASKDRKLELVFNSSGEMVIDKTTLSKGLYKMSLSWTRNATLYYKEAVITI
jgi:hypothetical protein